ncbi:hypothetical protein BP5796_07741 [Coleophoma crateriformis]|uniref:Xylanolytic transcriptional activator regulatory domain-containing protein n=1 Tax=Coleophoma crateriformis TaxID=565419 RepID=A0A3D8RCC1_9HELO|nr:hypothetical protein BP5796_07741 [Coleophoma crateriformis]
MSTDTGAPPTTDPKSETATPNEELDNPPQDDDSTKDEASINKSQSVETPPAEELLVRDGISTHYVNEMFLSRILDEERELRVAMGSPSAESSHPENSLSVQLGGIFSSFREPGPSAASLHPSRWHTVQLWQVFVANVDNIAKVVHIPTMQTALFAAIGNPGSAAADLNALMFSIYFAATTSLSSAAAATLLGQARGVALQKFKQGIEESLAAANLLETPTFKSLQALSLYLSCLRAYNGGKAGWSLNGLALRSAQSIGLHRDPDNFALKPFESEMRRRLWWHLRTSDARAAEDHGIALGSFHDNSDTRIPLNLNDSDLTPQMQELPKPREGWTEMTFPLVTIEASRVLQQIYRMPSGSAANNKAECQKMMSEMKARLENLYLQNCDPNIPLQRATKLLGRMLISKMDFIIQQQWHSGPFKDDSSRANESALIAAIASLDKTLQLQTDELLHGGQWMFQTYTQYHLLSFILFYLCLKPQCPAVEEAWRVVNSTFVVVEELNNHCEHGPKWAIMQALRARALRARHASGNANNEQDNDTSPSAETSNSVENFPADDAFANDIMNWDINAMDFSDWNNVAQSYEIQHFDN